MDRRDLASVRSTICTCSIGTIRGRGCADTISNRRQAVSSFPRPRPERAFPVARGDINDASPRTFLTERLSTRRAFPVAQRESPLMRLPRGAERRKLYPERPCLHIPRSAYTLPSTIAIAVIFHSTTLASWDHQTATQVLSFLSGAACHSFRLPPLTHLPHGLGGRQLQLRSRCERPVPA